VQKKYNMKVLVSGEDYKREIAMWRHMVDAVF